MPSGFTELSLSMYVPKITLASAFFSPSSLTSLRSSWKIACDTYVFRLFMKIRFDILF